MRIAAISDTHMPKGSRRLPPACLQELARADLIIHAGDLSTLAVLNELRALGPPVVAVHGNVDDGAVRAALAETELVDAAGHLIAVVHDAGPARGRAARLRRRFPDAEAVVFGHSHIPMIERAPAGPLIVNPGSPTERRRQSQHTMAVGEAVPAGELRFAIVAVD